MSVQDDYQNTVARMEPDIASIDAAGFYASAAISLKRIADALEVIAAKPTIDPHDLCHGINTAISEAGYAVLRNSRGA
jgi:hypothetical protein